MSTERKCPLSAILPLFLLGAVASCSAPASATAPYSAALDTSWSSPLVPAEATPISSSSANDALASDGTSETPVALSIPATASQQYRQAPPPGIRPMRHQHFMLLLGQRQLENSTWEGMDDQFALGLTFDKQLGESGLALDAGFQFSSDSTYRMPGNTKVYSDIFEFDLGLMKMFYPKKAPLRPYVGAGAAFSWASARIYNFYYRSDTDFTMGAYGRAGVAFQHDSGTLIGIDARYLGLTDLGIAGVNTDIDGWTFSFAIGYGF